MTIFKAASSITSMQRDPRIPDLVSLAEAAEMLGRTRQAVHVMLQRGDLKGAKVGGTWVIRRSVVEKRRQQQAT